MIELYIYFGAVWPSGNISLKMYIYEKYTGINFILTFILLDGYFLPIKN